MVVLSLFVTGIDLGDPVETRVAVGWPAGVDHDGLKPLLAIMRFPTLRLRHLERQLGEVQLPLLENDGIKTVVR